MLPVKNVSIPWLKVVTVLIFVLILQGIKEDTKFLRQNLFERPPKTVGWEYAEYLSMPYVYKNGYGFILDLPDKHYQADSIAELLLSIGSIDAKSYSQNKRGIIFIHLLRAMGMDGWELIQCNENNYQLMTCYFKRPLKR